VTALPEGPGQLPAASAALIILDGWGLAEPGPGNAVSQPRTPVFEELWSQYPHTRLTACGRAVGLPEGQMGNSEVGHLNLGAGAIVMQDLTRIDEAVPGGELVSNSVLREAFSGADGVGADGDRAAGGDDGAVADRVVAEAVTGSGRRSPGRTCRGFKWHLFDGSRFVS
jgi:hypothetical protein